MVCADVKALISNSSLDCYGSFLLVAMIFKFKKSETFHRFCAVPA